MTAPPSSIVRPSSKRPPATAGGSDPVAAETEEAETRKVPASSLNLENSLTDDADGDELLAVDDVLGGRQLLLADGREHGRRVAARGAVAVEPRHDGGRQVRHFVRAADPAEGDS